jgi:Periplasmic copper-binding protein (NosD)
VAWSVVAKNVVERNVGGILLTDEAAATHDNLVTGNTVRDNDRDCGITLPSHPAGFGLNGPLPGNGVYHNTISDNVSTGNGGAGVGMFTPTPGTASYENLVIGNTLLNNGLPGVALHSHAPGQNLNGNQIIGNTIAGNAADGDAQTSGPTGIIVFSDAAHGAAPITGMTITGNTISNEAIDIYVGTAAINLAVHHNNLLGSSAVGVQNAGTGVVDATQNYWGCPAGPGKPGCSSVQGAVTFAPWLTHRVRRN